MKRKVFITLFLLACAWIGTRAERRIAEHRAASVENCAAHASIAKQQRDNPADCARLKQEGVKGCNRKDGCKCKNTQCGDENEPGSEQEGEDAKCRVFCCPSLCKCHVCP